MTTSGFDVAALIACGMGLAFWLTDRDSPTSRALAVFLVALGAAILINVLGFEGRDGTYPWWVRLVGFVEAAAFWAGAEWGVRVGRTIPLDEHVRERGVALIRVAQGLMLLYALLSAASPEMREAQFLSAIESRDVQAGFFAFAGPAVLAGILVAIAGVRVLRRKPDLAERVRIIAMLMAMPLFASAVILPSRYAPMVIALGEVIFLLGALRYHVIQGARGQFMERFLAPQVAQLVRERGIKHAMGTRRVRVSVVCCDIRGFTAYARGEPPERVIRLLREFYRAVGEAAAEQGGTIKDLAGDGALILIGAPVAFEDHAARALRVAETIRRDVRETLKRVAGDLGLGVGVATGDVAVGIAGDGARLEYVAVGPAVNLASRLCDECADGEVRCDAFTLRDSGRTSDAEPEMLSVKGLDQAVMTYSV